MADSQSDRWSTRFKPRLAGHLSEIVRICPGTVQKCPCRHLMCLADNPARAKSPVFRGSGIGQLLRQLEGYMVSPDLSRFLDHVSIEGSQIPGMMLCCWPWTGAVDGKGRPRFYRNGRGRLARRALFEILIDKTLPANSAVVALCGNRQCVRPEHLFLCNNTDATAVGPKGRIGPGDGYMMRQMHQQGYEPEELAVAHDVSVALVKAYLYEAPTSSAAV